ncbi:MAG: ABC transporter permease subunit [Verrucomicrobia bacterium]|nr:ABC transporter permease subunit [Verrucomicrobiota bacterium]
MNAARRPWLLLALTGLLLVLIVTPVLVVTAGSVLNTSFLGLASEQWVGDGRDAEALFTTKWFGYVLSTYQPQLLMSVRLAVASVLGCIVLGVPAAYLLVRGQFPGRRFLEELVMLPLALPGIVVSIALIQAYLPIRGSWWFVLLGHLLYTLPFMVRSVASAMRSFDVAALERAAESLGASRWQRFWFVVVPNLRHSVTLGSLLVFAVSFGEFNVSYLLCTPLTATFPNALYATYTFNSFQVSSAATVIFLAVILPVLALIQWLGGDELKVEQGA